MTHKPMPTLTTYPTTPERPVTRAEIDRLTAIVAALEAERDDGRDADHVAKTAAESEASDATMRRLRREIDAQTGRPIARAMSSARAAVIMNRLVQQRVTDAEEIDRLTAIVERFGDAQARLHRVCELVESHRLARPVFEHYETATEALDRVLEIARGEG